MNTTPISIKAGSGNVYAALGLPDAQEMLVKPARRKTKTSVSAGSGRVNVVYA
jgi:hypothetical protein